MYVVRTAKELNRGTTPSPFPDTMRSIHGHGCGNITGRAEIMRNRYKIAPFGPAVAGCDRGAFHHRHSRRLWKDSPHGPVARKYCDALCAPSPTGPIAIRAELYNDGNGETGCGSLGACPSNGRDCDGSEMSRMRGGGSSRLLIMSLRDPTTKQTGHFRPTRRAACFLAPLCGAAPRSTIRVRYAIVAVS